MIWAWKCLLLSWLGNTLFFGHSSDSNGVSIADSFLKTVRKFSACGFEVCCLWSFRHAVMQGLRFERCRYTMACHEPWYKDDIPVMSAKEWSHGGGQRWLGGRQEVITENHLQVLLRFKIFASLELRFPAGWERVLAWAAIAAYRYILTEILHSDAQCLGARKIGERRMVLLDAATSAHRRKNWHIVNVGYRMLGTGQYRNTKGTQRHQHQSFPREDSRRNPLRRIMHLQSRSTDRTQFDWNLHKLDCKRQTTWTWATCLLSPFITIWISECDVQSGARTRRHHLWICRSLNFWTGETGSCWCSMVLVHMLTVPFNTMRLRFLWEVASSGWTVVSSEISISFFLRYSCNMVLTYQSHQRDKTTAASTEVMLHSLGHFFWRRLPKQSFILVGFRLWPDQICFPWICKLPNWWELSGNGYGYPEDFEATAGCMWLLHYIDDRFSNVFLHITMTLLFVILRSTANKTSCKPLKPLSRR